MKRAYGSEPVLLDSSPVTTGLTITRSRRQKRVRAMLALIAMLLVATGIGGWWFRHGHDSLLADVQHRAEYPLYVPGWLPAGARLDPKSIDSTPQVVTFSYKYAGNKSLIFSEQPRPGDFDFDGFYSDQLTSRQTYDTKLGQATTGLFEDLPFASIVVGHTWIILRAPQNLDADQFGRIVRSLRTE